jgi:hypothetical protein
MSRRKNGSWIFEIFIQSNSQTGRESKQIGDAAEAIGAEEISEKTARREKGKCWARRVSIPRGWRGPIRTDPLQVRRAGSKRSSSEGRGFFS